MELANRWQQLGEGINCIRQAANSDAKEVTKLLREAQFRHVHVDWHWPVDWLELGGFIVQEESKNGLEVGLTSRLFGSRTKLNACLAVVANPSPAAWVRVAAVRQCDDLAATLAAMLEWTLGYLRETAVTQLGWLAINNWPLDTLSRLGFEQTNRIDSLVKTGWKIPNAAQSSNINIRPVEPNDIPHLVQIETVAFEPLWRHSPSALHLAQKRSTSFDVALLNGKVVGFQISTGRNKSAHLARMAVDPNAQGVGVGSALLTHAFRLYEKSNFNTISLNTQTSNYKAKRLYGRFGFEYQGHSFPVWSYSW